MRDSIGLFIEQCCTVDSGCVLFKKTTDSHDLYLAYVDWAKANDAAKMYHYQFKAEMLFRGFDLTTPPSSHCQRITLKQHESKIS
jgi:hypothetical protein